MYVNVNNGERPDFGEDNDKLIRFLHVGAISFLYRHDNVYPCAGPGIFVVGGGGGGERPD